MLMGFPSGLSVSGVCMTLRACMILRVISLGPSIKYVSSISKSESITGVIVVVRVFPLWLVLRCSATGDVF